MSLIVDVHTHFLPPTLLEQVRQGSGPPKMAVRREVTPSGDTHRDVWIHGGLEYPLDANLVDVTARIAHLDRLGIDLALLSVAPDLFVYDATPAVTAEVCRIANDDLAGMITAGSGRLFGLVSVPLNDPDLAVAELTRTACLPGIVGAAVGTRVNTRMLDDESFDPFYAALERLRMPVLLHPHLEELDPSRLVADGLERYYLDNVIGNPLETCRAACRLISGGVLDRHPNLMVQLVHGGGHFLYQLGRMEHAFDVNEAARGKATRAPRDYLRQMLFDTIVYRQPVLEFLVETAGRTQVTFGTDLPFAMADTAPLALSSDPSAVAWRDDVLGRNAERAYHLQGR
jgi:aminocarboxymuconate-semialdehyde decarboxylase